MKILANTTNLIVASLFTLVNTQQSGVLKDEEQCHKVQFQLFGNDNNGWYGSKYHLNNDFGDLILEGSSNDAFSTIDLCLKSGCYGFTVDDHSTDIVDKRNQIGWTMGFYTGSLGETVKISIGNGVCTGKIYPYKYCLYLYKYLMYW